MKAKNKYEEIINQIRDAIIFNEFEPGTPLGENGLADRFGVSRTPIREALQRLESEHLVTVFPGKGAFVSEIRLKDVKEIYELRKVLEPLAAKSAVSRVNKEEIVIIRKKWATLSQRVASDENVPWKEVSALDRETHYLITSSTPNERLKEFILNLDAEVTRLQQVSARELSHVEETVNQHMEILDVLEDHDEERVALLLFQHIEKSESYILSKKNFD